jgi:DNA-binding Lrp family transcriptional regulator
MDMLEDSLDNRLLNDFQRNFPLCPAPFAELATRLGVAEGAVLRMLEQLRREGKISRVGAVFAPKRIGASTLAAMAVPPEMLVRVAEAINRFPEVNHNYEREHRYNLWFVVIAGSEGRLQAALGAIEQASGYPILKLPMEQEFLAGPGFSPDRMEVEAQVQSYAFLPPTQLGELERRLVMALQEGLPLFIRPFQVLASRVGCDEIEILERISRWCEEGIIKRFGVVVRNHERVHQANALLVQDIPDAQVGEFGARLAREPGVTLCYQRPRVPPDWPYNLSCMIHGEARSEVEKKIADLRERLNFNDFPHDVLFSLAR